MLDRIAYQRYQRHLEPCWRLVVARQLVCCACCLAVAGSVVAQAPDAQPTVADELAMKQSFLAEQHARLEKLLLRMAEFDSAANPRRAELLKKAFALSKDQDIKLQLDAIARLINQEKFNRAIDAQNAVRVDLQTCANKRQGREMDARPYIST